MVIGKKPPIDLNELEEEVEEEMEELGRGEGRKRSRSQPGNLSYMGGRGGGRDRYANEAGGGRDYWGIAVGVIISVVLAGVLIFVATPSKKDITTLQENQEELTSQMEVVSEKVDQSFTTLDKQVDTAITEARSAKSSLSAYALKTDVKSPDLSGYVMESTLDAYAKVSDVPAASDLSQYAKASDVAGTIANLQTQVTSLQNQVQSLATQQPGNTSRAVTVTIKSMGNTFYDTDTGGTAGVDSLTTSLRVTLTNNTLVNVSDVLLSVDFQIAPNLPGTPVATLVGGGTPWAIQYRDSQELDFLNAAWGLNVPANQSVNLVLTLTVKGVVSSDSPQGSYYYQAHVTTN